MKKLCFLLPALLILTISVFGQKQNNFWYFGEYAGIDFNSGAPVSLNDGAMTTTEGCSVISDTSGNLLFYTNGETVWNKNHQSMPNGFGLMGGFSSSQSAVIVPLPGSETTFYIFTVGQTGINGFRYSIVDLTLQSGLGDVTVKNVLLHPSVEEKITAVLNSNGTDVWIVAHNLNTTTFYACPLTASGPGALVSSSGGSIPGGVNQWTGCMKFSPDGTRLAVTNYALYSCDVLDFDASTGMVTTSFTFSPGNSFFAYGVEFSPDSKRLYVGNVDYIPGQVYQLDLTAGTTTDILASATLIASSNAVFYGALQLAPDGKIYLCKWADNTLGVINQPDSLPNACNYVDNGFSIAPNYGWLGLPCFIAMPTITPAPAFSSTDPTICEKFCTGFIDSSTNNPTAWQWYFEGGNPASSTDQNPANICYSNPGVFDVTLITTNASGSDTLILADYMTVYPTPPLPSISQTGYTLTSSTAATYQWQFNSVDIPGATNQIYEVLQSGYYTVLITDENGCSSSTTVNVLITGIGEVSENASVLIYPNPSNGDFIVELSNCQIDDEVEIQIHNTLGQVIFSSEEKINGSGFKKEIDLCKDAMHCISAGIYFVEIKMQNDFIMQKMQKKIMISH